MYFTLKRSQNVSSKRKTKKNPSSLSRVLCIIAESSDIKRSIYTALTIDEIYKSLFLASQKGLFGVVCVLLPIIEYSAYWYSASLCVASQYGYLNIVKRFMEEGSVPTVQALEHACLEGYTDIVTLLLENENLRLTDTKSLWPAIRNGHVDIVTLLLADCRLQPTIMCVRYASIYPNTTITKMLINHPCILYNTELYTLARENVFSNDMNTYILSKEAETIPQVRLEPYANQRVYDVIELEEYPIVDLLCDRTKLIVKIQDSYFSIDRDYFLKEIKEHVVIRFKCKQELLGAPYKKDVDMTVPYVMLQGNGSYLVRKYNLESVLRTHSILELEKTGNVVEFLASYSVVQVTPGVGLQNNPVNIIGTDHCQACTKQIEYSVKGVVLNVRTKN